MLSYGEIITIIQESSAYATKTVVIRKLERTLSDNLLEKKPVKVITGIRRSGKSFILKRLYEKLSSLVPKSNILFINFENDRLTGHLTLTSLRDFYDTFRNNSSPVHRLYLFFDEIQNIPEWEKFVRTIYDSRDDDIYITGSNSQLLSGEFSTVMGGRILEYKLQPFTFKEFLDFYGYRHLDIFTINEKKRELNLMFTES